MLDSSKTLFRQALSTFFVEKPIRLFQFAVLSAQRTDLAVVPETLDLCRELVREGLLVNLTPELVWPELAKGLSTSQPSVMFEVLQACGALAMFLPELSRLQGIPQPIHHHPEIDTFTHVMMVVDLAAARGESLEVRYAALVHDLGKGETPQSQWPGHHDHEEQGLPLVAAVSERLNVPASYGVLAMVVCREHTRVHRAQELKPSSFVHMFQRIDAYRQPNLVDALLRACECDARGRLGFQDRDYPQVHWVRTAFQAACSVDAEVLAAKCEDPDEHRERLHAARVHAVKLALKPLKQSFLRS